MVSKTEFLCISSNIYYYFRIFYSFEFCDLKNCSYLKYKCYVQKSQNTVKTPVATYLPGNKCKQVQFHFLNSVKILKFSGFFSSL